MAESVTTAGLTVLTLVAILVSIPTSTEALQRPKRSLTTARTPITTTTPGLVTGSSQQEWTAKTFPNPQLQPAACSRGTRRSWVCDPNGVLSKRQADVVDTLLMQQSAMGHCRCNKKCDKSRSHRGIQGAVGLVNKMYFMSSNPTFKELQKAAGKFAEYLRDEAWEFELCNDDYVIFVSVKDRQVFTATGDNARPIMTDACVRMVYDEVRPMLSKGDFGNALEQMVRKYTDVLRFQHHCNRPAGFSTGTASTGTIIGAIAGFLGIASCCGVGCFLARKQKGGSSSSSSAETHHLHHPNEDIYNQSIRKHSFDHQKSDRRGSADSGGAGGGF